MLMHRKQLCGLTVTQNGTIHSIQRLRPGRKKERLNGRNKGYLFDTAYRQDHLQGACPSLNQKRYLESYAKQRGYTNLVHYTDDTVILGLN